MPGDLRVFLAARHRGADSARDSVLIVVPFCCMDSSPVPSSAGMPSHRSTTAGYSRRGRGGSAVLPWWICGPVAADDAVGGEVTYGCRCGWLVGGAAGALGGPLGTAAAPPRSVPAPSGCRCPAHRLDAGAARSAHRDRAGFVGLPAARRRTAGADRPLAAAVADPRRVARRHPDVLVLHFRPGRSSWPPWWPCSRPRAGPPGRWYGG